MNKDEALKCLAIAQRHRDSGNYASARKFCQKSITLSSTPEALKLLAQIDDLEAAANAGPSSGSYTSSTEAHPSASGAHHRHTNGSASSSKAAPNGTAGGSGGEKREYTPDQVAIVKRVRACRVTEYYEILAVKRDCEEAEVKKAYRKVSKSCNDDEASTINGLCSSHYSYTQTRTVLLERMRPSKVSSLLINWLPQLLRMLLSVVSKAFQILSGMLRLSHKVASLTNTHGRSSKACSFRPARLGPRFTVRRHVIFGRHWDVRLLWQFWRVVRRGTQSGGPI